jgi:hypothetical protein
MAAAPFDKPPDPLMFAEIARTAHASGLTEGSEFEEITDPDGTAPGDEQAGDYASRVRGMIDDAREFNAEVLTPIREKGILFYLGALPELDEEGRSTIVKTEVRDTILAMLPSLMRIFTAQETTCVFLPNSKDGVAIAEQSTDYIQYVFNYDNPGYMILMDIFKDAMIKSMGVCQWWTDQNQEVVDDTYSRLTLPQRQFLISQNGNEVVSERPYSRPGPDGVSIQPAFDMVIRRTTRSPRHRVQAVPPDEFRINRTSTSVKDAALIGRERFATQTELLIRGFPRELIDQNKDFSGGDLRFSMERMLRNQGSDSPFGRDSAEPLCRFGEYWMRIDKNGDGIAELRHICVIGDNQAIVLDEAAHRPKMAICCVDPEPHSIVGHSISELIADLQVIGSNILRGSLDSLAQSIYPRLVGVDTQVDWDDVLNQAIGAPIRVKDIGALTQLAYQFNGDAAFGMLDRLDAIRIARTGITEQSKGLDPKALQSTTMKGVEMIVTGAQERIELVARTAAYTFMTDLFAGLLQEVCDNPIPERVVKLRGNYIEVKPDQFDATMICVPNAAMGKGSDSDRYLMYNTILAKQEAIIAQMGPGNPMVSPIEYRNTLADLLGIAGIKNVDRYFKEITPEGLQEFLAMLQQKEDPNLVLAKAEADKVRATIVKILSDARVKTEDLSLTDDRERDKTEGDQMLKAADIDAKYGASVDTAAIQALWKEPRQPPAGMLGEGGPPGADPNAVGPATPPPDAQAMPGQPAGGGSKPELPLRSALGHAPPKLLGGASAGQPPGLLTPGGPSA